MKDAKACRKFAAHIKTLEEKIQAEDIAFYFDGASFQHKYNPFNEAKLTHTVTSRKKSAGLDLNCTAKGSHVGSGGRVAHFLVAIAFNRGIILFEQYHGSINGEMFAQFIQSISTTHLRKTQTRNRNFFTSWRPKSKRQEDQGCT